MKNNAKEAVLQARPKAKNPWMDAWHSLKKNKMACIGGIVLLIFINRKAVHDPYIAVITCPSAEAEKAAANMKAPTANFLRMFILS